MTKPYSPPSFRAPGPLTGQLGYVPAPRSRGSHAARFIRFGKLPGNIACRFRGRTYYLPFTTTILFSLILLLISRFI